MTSQVQMYWLGQAVPIVLHEHVSRAAYVTDCAQSQLFQLCREACCVWGSDFHRIAERIGPIKTGSDFNVECCGN